VTPLVSIRAALSDPNLLGNALRGDSWLTWRAKALKELERGWQKAMDKIAERAGRSKGPSMRRITPSPLGSAF
jgi:hypothetical protein